MATFSHKGRREESGLNATYRRCHPARHSLESRNSSAMRWTSRAPPSWERGREIDRRLAHPITAWRRDGAASPAQRAAEGGYARRLSRRDRSWETGVVRRR